MTPNLRSLVAKAYRVRQGHTFSSSSSSSTAPNPIGDKGKELNVTPLLDVVSSIAFWFTTGYAVHSGWEMWRMLKIKQDSDKQMEIYEIEKERYFEKLRRRISGLYED